MGNFDRQKRSGKNGQIKMKASDFAKSIFLMIHDIKERRVMEKNIRRGTEETTMTKPKYFHLTSTGMSYIPNIKGNQSVIDETACG